MDDQYFSLPISILKIIHSPKRPENTFSNFMGGFKSKGWGIIIFASIQLTHQKRVQTIVLHDSWGLNPAKLNQHLAIYQGGGACKIFMVAEGLHQKFDCGLTRSLIPRPMT